MLQLDNPERVHVGRQLELHYRHLGISDGEMEQALGNGSAIELKWMVGAVDLSILRIRRFHFAMIEAYERAATRIEQPVPYREQWFTTVRDNQLHDQVAAGGRRTAWWWGASRTQRGAGALCYVCDVLIHPYDLGRGVTHPVRLAVMNHRAQHVAQLIGATTTAHGRKR